MEYFVICSITFLTCVLTLFSGFGLGTILMPVLAVFFPLDLAVALTAIVHFLNNILKFLMFARHADRNIIVRFGVSAAVAAFLGAQILVVLGSGAPIVQYKLGTWACSVTAMKLVMAVIIFVFAFLELTPWFSQLSFDKKYLGFGGVLSGFFGGLSGHQGAFRSMFLIKSGLSKEAFIATGVVIACLVDISRLGVYVGHFAHAGIQQNMFLLIIVPLCALIGTVLGTRLVKKVALPFIQGLVSILLIAISLAMGFGII